jgi:hypothetical protein
MNCVIRAELSLYWSSKKVQSVPSWQTTFVGPMRTRGWAELHDWKLDRASGTPPPVPVPARAFAGFERSAAWVTGSELVIGGGLTAN